MLGRILLAFPLQLSRLEALPTTRRAHPRHIPIMYRSNLGGWSFEMLTKVAILGAAFGLVSQMRYTRSAAIKGSLADLYNSWMN